MWKFTLGKLVVPTIFKDVDLLLELESRYDEIIHEVKEINNRVFLKIDADSICEASNLHALEEATYNVNL